jgi:transposase-like protein
LSEQKRYCAVLKMATRIYDFTSGLKAAKDAITQASAAPKPQDEGERAITEAIEIVVDNLKNSDELSAARATIEQAMYYLDGTLSSIKSQIDLAKSRALESQYADPIWWRRVNSAQRFKGRQRQQLQNKFGEVNRRLRANRATANANEQLTREQAFVRIAQIHLPPETFQRLWELVELTLPKE